MQASPIIHTAVVKSPMYKIGLNTWARQEEKIQNVSQNSTSSKFHLDIHMICFFTLCAEPFKPIYLKEMVKKNLVQPKKKMGKR